MEHISLAHNAGRRRSDACGGNGRLRPAARGEGGLEDGWNAEEEERDEANGKVDEDVGGRGEER